LAKLGPERTPIRISFLAGDAWDNTSLITWVWIRWLPIREKRKKAKKNKL